MHQTTIEHFEIYKRPWLINVAVILMIAFLVGMMVVNKIPTMNQLNRVTGALLALIYLLNLFRQPHKIPIEFVLLLLFVLWTAVTGIAVASNKLLYFHMLSTISQIWVMMVTIGGLTILTGNPKRGFAAVIVASMVLGGYIIVTGEYVVAQEGKRVSGIVSNTNAMAMIMLMGVASLLYFWGEVRSKLGKTILFGFFAIMVIMVIYSGSRKGFLCMMLLGVGWLWFCYRRFVLQNFKMMLLVVVVVVMGGCFARYVIQQTPLGERFATADTAVEGRFTLYEDGYRMLTGSSVSFIAGIGLDNFRLHSRSGFEAHSSYMEILADTGIVGFGIYFSMFIFLWLKCNRVVKQTDRFSFLYSAGLCKAFILMLLAVSFGSPTFKSIFPCFTLAVFIGHISALERQLKAEAIT